MKQTLILIFTFIITVQTCFTQKVWTLRQCIDYALENNIEIKQTELNGQLIENNLNTVKNSKLPDLSASLSHTNYFGRGPSRDGTYQDNNQMSSSANIAASLTIFNGMRIKHEIKSYTLNLQAALEDLEKAKNDVALNITAYYLKTLLCKELVRIAESQVEISRQQVERSQLLTENGKSLKSELMESKALWAKDKLNLTQCKNDLSSAILELSQALNRKSSAGFDIEEPQSEMVLVEALNSLHKCDTAVLFAESDHRPEIRSAKLQIQSSRHDLRIAQAARYPSVSLSGGYSNSYYYSFITGYNNAAFRNQLKNNGNEYIGLNISVPIFNKLATRNQIRNARINIKLQELNLENAKMALRKEIETAYHNAETSYEKYLSARESFEAAREAFHYENEKIAVGRSTLFDYNDAKTRMEKSESEMMQAKYEVIFNCKILDFYNGSKL